MEESESENEELEAPGNELEDLVERQEDEDLIEESKESIGVPIPT